jgi:hypothetical protein
VRVGWASKPVGTIGEITKGIGQLILNMTLEPWLLGVLGLVAVVHTIAVVAVYRTARSGAGHRSGANDGVVCTECGTDNESPYRFCRECAAELPGPGDQLGPTPTLAEGRYSN